MTPVEPEVPQHPNQLLIGGQWRPAEEGRTFEVTNPATGQVLATVADASASDGAAAIAAAKSAQAELKATSPSWRAQVLRTVASRLREREDELARLITLEMGKPLGEARSEVAYAANFFSWFADEALRITGDFRLTPEGNARIVVQRQGVGPCLLVTPWNFPLAMGARKIAPAIAAGCTSVLKPAPQTPLASLVLAEILQEAGCMPGVVNVVTTTRAAEVVEEVIGSGDARKISFTGSTGVGKLLLAQASAQVMRTSMELGGNAPFVVFEDADLDAAVEGAMIAKMRNMGQACTAANRFLIAEPVAEEFIRRFTARMAALKTGPGWLPNVDVGPLIDGLAVAKFQRLIEDAVDRGATIETGGHKLDGQFVEPTVLSGVSEDSAVLSEEIFAPLAPIVTFVSEEQAVERANNTRHGLISYVYTKDIDRSLRLVENLESGMVGVNVGIVSNAAAPFGGVKESGLGREGGFEGIDEYLNTSYAAFGRSA